MTRRNLTDREEKDAAWLDVRAVARVRASSEDPAHRIDHALAEAGQWRAAEPGDQVIELRFVPPRDLTRIRLVFVENEVPRTQQFTIRWSARRGEMQGEVVRQQFNFSPSGATREVEDYRVDLRSVDALRIMLIPSVDRQPSFASLSHLQLA